MESSAGTDMDADDIRNALKYLVDPFHRRMLERIRHNRFRDAEAQPLETDEQGQQLGLSR
jgi:hypothetical protein